MSIKDDFIKNYHPETGDQRRVYKDYNISKDERMPIFEEAVAKFEAAESEPLDLPPFSDDLSKDEMVEHLKTYHYPDSGGFYVSGHLVSASGTKATKDDLRKHHADLHENEAANYTVNFRQEKREGKYVYRWAVKGLPVPHRHGGIALSEEQAKVLTAVRQNQKASGTTLGARDQKVLKELVDNDFGSLKAEMRAFAADTLSAQIADINEEWDRKEKSIPDFATQATEQHRKHYDKVRALQQRHAEEMKALTEAGEDAAKKIADKAREKGVVLKRDTENFVDESGLRKNREVYKAEVEGRKEAIAEATAENKKMVDRALMTVEKQRLTAQRQVLLSSVPDAALPIVESIPDAKTLMVEAQMIPAKEIEATS